MAIQPFVSVEESIEALMEERRNCAKDTLKCRNGHEVTSWPQGGGFQVRFNHLPVPAAIEQIREQLTDRLEQRDSQGSYDLPVKRIEFHTLTGVVRVVADKSRQHLMR